MNETTNAPMHAHHETNPSATVNRTGPEAWSGRGSGLNLLIRVDRTGPEEGPVDGEKNCDYKNCESFWHKNLCWNWRIQFSRCCIRRNPSAFAFQARKRILDYWFFSKVKLADLSIRIFYLFSKRSGPSVFVPDPVPDPRFGSGPSSGPVRMSRNNSRMK